MSLTEVGRDPANIEQVLSGWSGALGFDVGGNVGRVAADLAERFTHVVSCEPARESYAELQRVTFRLPNITALNVAVSDVNDVVELSVQEHPIRSGQLTSPIPGSEVWGRIIDVRNVPATTLDGLAKQYGAPDAVKIDTEGHELRIVRGGLATLTRHSPKLYVEIHNADLGKEIAAILRPVYGDRLQTIRHPGYPSGSWGHLNHYYLIAE